MSTSILSQVFVYADKPVRVAGNIEKPLFCAQDVCAVLGIANSRDALEALDADEKDEVGLTDTIGRKQQMLHVTESGLYALIFKSRKAEAKRFRKWVTSEVLPEIRKNGFFLPTSQAHFGSESTQEFFDVIRELVALGVSPDAACNSVRLNIHQKSSQTRSVPAIRPVDQKLDIELDCSWNVAVDRVVQRYGVSAKNAASMLGRAVSNKTIVCPERNGVFHHA